jgi:hypothetical protein
MNSPNAPPPPTERPRASGRQSAGQAQEKHTPPGYRRAAYVDVCAATRGAITSALAKGAPAGALRVLLAFIVETTSWSKLEARITLRRIGDLTGMSEREVRKAVKWLKEQEIVKWTPGDSLPGQARRSSVVALPHPGPLRTPVHDGPPSESGRDPGWNGVPTLGHHDPRTENPFEKDSRTVDPAAAVLDEAPAPVDPGAFIDRLRREHGFRHGVRT